MGEEGVYVDPMYRRFLLEQQEKSKSIGVLWIHKCPKCGLDTTMFRDGSVMTWPK